MDIQANHNFKNHGMQKQSKKTKQTSQGIVPFFVTEHGSYFEIKPPLYIHSKKYSCGDRYLPVIIIWHYKMTVVHFKFTK